MTKQKPPFSQAKMGRKSRRLKNHQDKMLDMLIRAGDVTPWNASILVGCGYEYALKKYREHPRGVYSKIP